VSKGSHSIELDVPRREAWELLIGPGKRDWYYRLTPHGEFVEGAHISWVDVDGKPAEESDVVTAEPETRLVLRTRFVFVPALAAASPHMVTWELTGDGERCTVRMSWEAEGPASAMPGQISEIAARDRAHGAGQHHEPDVEVPRAGVGGHRQERQRARKGDAGVLDQDAQGGRRVAHCLRDRPNIQMHQLFL
jgi:hypothetical protein